MEEPGGNLPFVIHFVLCWRFLLSPLHNGFSFEIVL